MAAEKDAGENIVAVSEEHIEEIDLTDPDFKLDSAAAAQLLAAAGGNKQLINALQAKLNSMVGQSSGYLESLPAPVRRRIDYLRNLQEQHDQLEDQFRAERAALEAKYRALYEPLYAKRSDVVLGKAEPPPGAEGEAAPEAKDEKDAPKGIPEFWMGVLRNHEHIGERITEKDEAALAFLTDIRSEPLTGEQSGFRLVFSFAANPHFSNTELTKTYIMVDDDEPILERAEGTKIDWQAGKNPTIKVMKKKAKGGKGGGKVQTKTEPCESFFNFFSPPPVPQEDEELDEEEMEELQAALEEDYEIGEIIKDKLIPQAVLWYTGEAAEMDDEDEEDEDDDEEGDDEGDEDEDDDEEEEDDEEAEAGAGAPAAPRAKKGGPQDTKEQPAECKQQ